MRRFILSIALAALSISANADHHSAEGPRLAEIYACTLNQGVSAADVVALGSGEFRQFAESHELQMNSFLWEAVAVTPPLDEPDVRWVNYFPDWKHYYQANDAWLANGTSIAKKIDSMLTCNKPFFTSVHQAGATPPRAEIKPLYVRVCNLKEGKTIADALSYRKAVNAIQNEEIDGTVGSALLTPGFGVTGIDYAAMVTGTQTDMAAVLDNSRTMATMKKLEDAGHGGPAECSVNLHRSHLMVSQ